MEYLQAVFFFTLMTAFVTCQNQFPQQPPQQNFPQNQQTTQNQNFQPQPGMNQNQPMQNQNFQPQPGMNQNQPMQNQNFQPQPGMNQNQPMQNQNVQPQPGMNQNQQNALQPPQPQPTRNSNTNGNQNNANAGNQRLSSDQRSQLTCAQAGRTAVSQCFQSNGGFQMITVIGLLSNGTQGQLPANSDQVKTRLCKSQSQIVTCIFNNVRKFNGSEQCNTLLAFVRLEQETVGLLNGVQQMCGTGIMPKVTPCMQRINFDMAQCFDEVGLNSDLYSPRGSGMQGAIIGGNREAARMFCDKRRALFACQNRVLEKCPRAKDLQALSGTEQQSMQNGMDVLCKDVDVYVSGLVCFQSPPRKVETCANGLIRDMTELTMRQIRENLQLDAFYTEYCRVRIANLRCDNKAWGQACKPVAIGLKNEFQCNLLPTKCKSEPAIRELYDQSCAEASFSRELRTPDSGASSNIAGVASVLTFVLTTSLLLL